MYVCIYVIISKKKKKKKKKKKIIKKKSNSNNSFKILNWLYFNSSTKKQLKEFLIEETQNKNKKSKLIAIQIYKNIIDEQSHALKKNEGKISDFGIL